MHSRSSAALAHWQEALALATATDYTVYQAHITGNLGIVLVELKDLQASEAYHLESLRLYEQLGAVNGYAREQMNIAITYLLQENLPEAMSEASGGLRLAQDIDYRLFMPYRLTGVARIDYALGNYLQARNLNLEALALSRETGDKYVEVEALTGLTLASTTLLDYAAASAYSERAVELARDIGSDSKLLGAVLARADLFAVLGQCEHAGKLAAIVRSHPATVSYERAFADKLLEAVEPKLSSRQQKLVEGFARTTPLERAAEAAVEYPLP